MSSVQALRDFINERLTAAAGEIFTVFQQTVVQYEEEIDRQHKLLQIRWKPQIKFHRTESPNQHVSNQKTSSSLEQEEHEAPHIKEEEDLVEVTVTDGESDNSHDSVRDLTTQRLTAAAVEIFTLFEQTIVQYEEEIDRQHRLLEIIWKPQIKSHRTELLQHNVCKEEQQLFQQGGNASPEQEESIIQQNKDEEPCTSQEGEQLALKLEADTFMVTSADEDSFLCEPDADSEQLHSYDSDSCDPKEISQHQFYRREYFFNPQSNSRLEREEPEPPHITMSGERPRGSRVREQLELNLETDGFIETSSEEQIHFSESDAEQLLSHRAEIADRHSLKKGACFDSGSKNVTLETKSIFHSDNADDSLMSEYQPESFRRNVSLLIHMRNHTRETPFLCTTCGKRFLNLSSLKRHAMNHTGENPYSCVTCGKSFTRQSYLLVHMRIHTGEKPHCCVTCGKSFTQQNNLLVHMRTHTGERPYSCETCGKSFSLHGNLLVHMRTHTGEKPYSCGKCGKKFSRRDTLLVHTRTHTDEKPYYCETCGKSFSQQRYLLRHMRIHTV